MRDLVRNNPHAAKAVAVPVNNIIGSGLMPCAASGNNTLDRKVATLFERWTAECEADGQLDFYGLQTLICREMVEAGEVLVRRRLRRSSDGLPVPLQLQVLEADFLDATKSGALDAGRLVQGVEFNPVGKRRAYWLHAEHPGDAYGAMQNGLQSRPVPATVIAHVYEKQRTQARGVPWGAAVIRSLRDLDDYEVAELVRKKTEACVTAIVFGDDEAQQGIVPSVVDADGNRNEEPRLARQQHPPDRALCRRLRRWPARRLHLRHRRRGRRPRRAVETALVGVLRHHQGRLPGLDRRRQGLLGRHQQALHHGRQRRHACRRGRRSGGERRGRHRRPGPPERNLLMSAFAAAVGALFADPNIGRDAVYIAYGGTPVMVRAVARRADAISDVRLWSETTHFNLRVAEVANPRPGDRLEIDRDAFLIQGEPVRDHERLVWTLDLKPA